MAVYKLTGTGKMVKMPKAELKAMAKRDHKNQQLLVKAIMEHYNVPPKDGDEVERFRAALYHHMTCDNPEHNHDAMLVEWEASTPNQKER